MEFSFNEAVLDDPDALAAGDPSDMLRAVATSGAQIREMTTYTAEAGIEVLAEDRPRAVILSAVGSSAAACEVLRALVGDDVHLPLIDVPGRCCRGGSDRSISSLRSPDPGRRNQRSRLSPRRDAGGAASSRSLRRVRRWRMRATAFTACIFRPIVPHGTPERVCGRSSRRSSPSRICWDWRLFPPRNSRSPRTASTKWRKRAARAANRLSTQPSSWRWKSPGAFRSSGGRASFAEPQRKGLPANCTPTPNTRHWTAVYRRRRTAASRFSTGRLQRRRRLTSSMTRSTR